MHAVIIRPTPHHDLDALAAQLAPLLDLRLDTVRTMLARGPLTVESALSHEEGVFLQARLLAIGLPAELVDEAAPNSPTPHIQPPPPQPTPHDIFSFDLEAELDEALGALTASQFPPVTPTNLPPPQTQTPSLAPAPASAAGWGALFPELSPTSPQITPSSTSQPKRAVTVTPAPTLKPVPALNFGAEPIKAPAPITPMASVTMSSAPPIEPPRSPARFDGAQLMSALSSRHEDELPPYFKTGFDPRPPHSPEIARALSIIAPGAGQIYNGEEHKALDYGLRFFLIKPWIQGAKQANARAHKIATFWAPRPPEGNLWRATRYAFFWYLATCGLLFASVLFVNLILQRTLYREPPPLHVAQLGTASEEARIAVRKARIAGLNALNDVFAETAAQRSQMDDKERMERVFLRGFEDCRASRFPLCEATMTRVIELAGGTHRDARRLQTWAALRRQGGTQPMPDVDGLDGITSIAEYEERARFTQQPDDPAPEPPDLASPDLGAMEDDAREDAGAAAIATP